MSTILEARHIIKEFPGVRALDDVTFSLEKKQYTLVGENGAGKSTLINVTERGFSGIYLRGRILLEDNPVQFKTIVKPVRLNRSYPSGIESFGELGGGQLFHWAEMHAHGIFKQEEMLLETEEWLKS